MYIWCQLRVASIRFVGLSRVDGPCPVLSTDHNFATTMSEAQITESFQPSPDLNKSTTPPRITPSPDATESGLSWLTYQETLLVKPTYHNAPELKLSRKREREVSVEPVTTPTASHVLGTRRCFTQSVMLT